MTGDLTAAVIVRPNFLAAMSKHAGLIQWCKSHESGTRSDIWMQGLWEFIYLRWYTLHLCLFGKIAGHVEETSLLLLQLWQMSRVKEAEHHICQR